MSDQDPIQSSAPAQAQMQAVENGQNPALTPQVDANQPPASNAPTTTPSTSSPVVPAPSAAPADPVAAKHGIIGRMISGFKGSGSGTSASQFWRSLIGGALVGMGAAENAPVTARGPYGDVKDTSMGGAASRGFQAGMGQAEQQQDRQRKQAQQQKEEARRDQESKIQLDDSVLRKHADARAQQASIDASVEHEKGMRVLDQRIAAGDWDAAQKITERANQQVKFFNDLNEVGGKPLTGSDGQPLQFATHEEAEQAAHDNPKFFIGDFKTRTAYDPTTNKFSVYKVPDTDIKNVKLKDAQDGSIHTIPRMSPSEYLDYQTRVQNLKKGALEVEKVTAEIGRLKNDVKASGLYGAALKELSGATDKDGNVDLTKISAGNRTVLYEHSAKGLEDGLRARSAAIEKHTKAVDAGDATAIDEANQNIEDATQVVRHYSDTLTKVSGNKKATTPEQVQTRNAAVIAATRAQALFSKEDNSSDAFNIVNAQVKARTISKEEGEAIMGEYMKLTNKAQSLQQQKAPSMTDDVQLPAESSEPAFQPPL